MKHEDSVSGYMTVTTAELLSPRYTDIEVVTETERTLLLRAKRLGRWWLLKGLPAQRAGQPLYEQALSKEFDLTQRLQHHGVVTAVDFVGLGDRYPGHFIVMEWIEGRTLAQWLRERHSRRDKIRIVSQLLDAVEYIHGLGVVHRDIKPENIMVSRQGDNVKLIDFGLADCDSYDILKFSAGTPGYVSPEQGECMQADIRNDIYSIGVVLRDCCPGIRYRNVIRRCMADAGRRYRDVGAVRRAIRRAGWLSSVLTAVAVIALIAGLLLSLPMREEQAPPAEIPVPVTDVQSDTASVVAVAENRTSQRHNVQASEAVDADDAHRQAVDSLLVCARRVFELAASQLITELDTATCAASIRHYGTPPKAWREYYHKIDWRGQGLSDSDLDRIYSEMKRYEYDRYREFDRLRKERNLWTKN